MGDGELGQPPRLQELTRTQQGEGPPQEPAREERGVAQLLDVGPGLVQGGEALAVAAALEVGHRLPEPGLGQRPRVARPLEPLDRPVGDRPPLVEVEVAGHGGEGPLAAGRAIVALVDALGLGGHGVDEALLEAAEPEAGLGAEGEQTGPQHRGPVGEAVEGTGEPQVGLGLVAAEVPVGPELADELAELVGGPPRRGAR